MKILMRLILLLLFLFAGCGKNINAPANTAAITTATSPVTSWMLVNISVPAPGVVGSTTTINYQGHTYLMGANTPTNIQNLIYAIPQGTSVQKNIIGTFSRETGHFPNPTATFDVITITQIQ